MNAIRTYGNRLLSRWQSALYAVLDQGEEVVPDLGADHPAMAATYVACDEVEKDLTGEVHHPLAVPVETSALMLGCARLYVSLVAAYIRGDEERAEELENELRYSVCDPLWAKSLIEFHKGDHIEIPYRRYQSLDDFVVPLPEKEGLKIAFVSDWATGTSIARNVMRCIAEHQPDILIHLGDIYYSGTRKEAEKNFLNVVRDYIPASVPVYALAGNHDLYAGGEGYYWLLDQLGQPASYFCLRNEHWQFLAIGAPTDNDNPTDIMASVPPIDGEELRWHHHKLDTAEGRKTIMLSHYQLFTASGGLMHTPDNRPMAVNPVLHAAFKERLHQIDLWLWGHEHNFIVFEPFLGLKRGRCIGSGALPVSLLWQPYQTLPNLVLPDYVDSPPRINPHARLGHDGDHYYHGFGLLTLNGAKGAMEYYQVAGSKGSSQIIFREEL